MMIDWIFKTGGCVIVVFSIYTLDAVAIEKVVVPPKTARKFKAASSSTGKRLSKKVSKKASPKVQSLLPNGFVPEVTSTPYGTTVVSSGQPNYITPPNISFIPKSKDESDKDFIKRKAESTQKYKDAASQFLEYLKTKYPGQEINDDFYDRNFNTINNSIPHYDPSSPEYTRNTQLCSTDFNAEEKARQLAGYNCNMQSNDPLTAMTCNLYYEALGQPFEGMVAAGETVVTRLYNNGFPVNGSTPTIKNIIYDYGMVTRGNRQVKVAQYSWTVENKNHEMSGGPALTEVVRAANEALCRPPGRFSNYWNPSIASPAWGPACKGKTQIGAHLFCYSDAMRTVDRTAETIRNYQAQAEGGVYNSTPGSATN